jgi:hypothetical protein
MIFITDPSHVSATVNGVGSERDFHLLEDSYYRMDTSRKRISPKPDESVNIGDYLYIGEVGEYWLIYSHLIKPIL